MADGGEGPGGDAWPGEASDLGLEVVQAAMSLDLDAVGVRKEHVVAIAREHERSPGGLRRDLTEEPCVVPTGFGG